MARWIPLPYLVTGPVLLDVYGMARLDPIVPLAADWWWGELLAIAVCLLPGVLLAELTVRRRALRVRVALQVMLFTSVLFVAVPVLTMTATRHAPAFRVAGDRRVHVGGPVDMILIQIGAVITLIALAAVIEFYCAGGTPWQWDPPEQLVTSGPYAYLANPMQVCGVLLIALTAAEDHPGALRRIRYEHDSPSYALDGIRAVGAVMTHLNLAWAIVGWLISAPVIAQFLQLLIDASGGAPRDLPT